MSEYYIKSQSYNGHDLTMWLDTNTGSTATPAGDGTEPTNTITYAIDDLQTLALTADDTGDTLTNVALTDLRVTAISIDGDPKIYSAAFTKLKAEGVLTITDGVSSFTAGEGVDVYYLEAADGAALPGIRKSELQERWIQTEADLKKEVDGVGDNDIYQWMSDLGVSRE